MLCAYEKCPHGKTKEELVKAIEERLQAFYGVKKEIEFADIKEVSEQSISALLEA